MTKHIIITKGLPGSGKTSWAKQYQDNNKGRYIRINKDDLRSMSFNSNYSSDNEKFILNTRDNMIIEGLSKGKHVIIDDTNLSEKHEKRISNIVRNYNKINNDQVQIRKREFLDVSLEECIKRDLNRVNSVGEKVIRQMHKQFLEEKVDKVPFDKKLSNCIICDIDGTLAHMVDRSPYDFDRVEEDSLDLCIRDLLQKYYFEHTSIILLSGRDESCRKSTETWLKKHTVKYNDLYMRKEEDVRKDIVVKRELYEKYINYKYNVTFVLDDRNCCVKLWRGLGLKCFQVAEGDF